MLTDIKLRNARPGSQPYKLSDGNQLYLFVTRSGGKLWRLNYAFGGKQKSLSFGRYPIVGLAEARAKRDAAKALLLGGFDPSALKRMIESIKEDADRNTFERIARQWHENNVPR